MFLGCMNLLLHVDLHRWCGVTFIRPRRQDVQFCADIFRGLQWGLRFTSQLCQEFGSLDYEKNKKELILGGTSDQIFNSRRWVSNPVRIAHQHMGWPVRHRAFLNTWLWHSPKKERCFVGSFKVRLCYPCRLNYVTTHNKSLTMIGRLHG